MDKMDIFGATVVCLNVWAAAINNNPALGVVNISAATICTIILLCKHR